MKTVGAYEAKTHLPRLIEEASRGEEIVITKHGVPKAKLVPVISTTREDVERVFREMRKFRETHKLDGLKIRDMIEEGRRF